MFAYAWENGLLAGDQRRREGVQLVAISERVTKGLKRKIENGRLSIFRVRQRLQKRDDGVDLCIVKTGFLPRAAVVRSDRGVHVFSVLGRHVVVRAGARIPALRIGPPRGVEGD